MTLGERVKELRELHRFTRQQLSNASGVPYNTIRRLELGEHQSVRLKDARAIGIALGVSLDELTKTVDEWVEAAAVDDACQLTTAGPVGVFENTLTEL